MSDFVFMRYELKYMCTQTQAENLQAEIENRMQKDKHGESTIQSLYFDTKDDRLILSSLDKPTYKEKLRLRCYGLNDSDKDVFLEMKRKCRGVVYKRRLVGKEEELSEQIVRKEWNSQIGRELSYFISFYPELYPKMLILYDRTAFFDPESDLRVTFDRRIRYRTDCLNFHTSLDGTPLLEDGTCLLEIKTGVAIPLWLCRLLEKEKVYKTSFSKYGTAFLRKYNNHLQGESIYV